MKIIAIMLGILLAPALLSADVGSLLDQAAAIKPGDNKAWVEARDNITALGKDALPELRQAAAEANWTSEGWVRAMVAETCRLRIESPEIAEAVDKPRGLDPERYKLFRKPMPLCHRDLRQLGKDGVPLLLERWRWTLESHAYSKGEAGRAERNCFARALLAVPGELADARARFAMEDALRNIALENTWRADAAVSLGQTGGTAALPTLAELFDSAEQSTAVREGCAWAMGRVAHMDAAIALKDRLGQDGQPLELKRALINGLGILGNSWGWRARGVMQQPAGDAIRKVCAETLVEAIRTLPAEADYISRALAEVAWEASLADVSEIMLNDESAEVRNAAKLCHEPLKTAIERDK